MVLLLVTRLKCTRSLQSTDLSVVCCRTDIFGDAAFSHEAQRQWNNDPDDRRTPENVEIFTRKLIKTYITCFTWIYLTSLCMILDFLCFNYINKPILIFLFNLF